MYYVIDVEYAKWEKEQKAAIARSTPINGGGL